MVAGSGAAGMTAALTAAHLGLSVVVIEKTGFFGGSTARSGGGIWAPGNAVLRAAGVGDTPEQARAYLAHVAGDGVPAELRRALLEHAPAMLGLVLANTPVRFAWVPGYADYYPEAPGGLARGAQHRAGAVRRPQARRRAGSPRPALPAVPERRDHHPGRVPLAEPGPAPSARRAGRGQGRGTGGAHAGCSGHRMLSLGQALAAGLRAGLMASGVPVWLDTPMTGLQVRDGRVTRGPRHARRRAGADPGPARGADRDRRVRAQRGDAPPVPARAGRHRSGRPARPGTPATGSWRGLDLGAAVGLMDDAWWGPSIPLPGGPYFCLAERSLPGCILVNGAGQRFVNESAPYVDAVHAMYEANTPENPHIPAWLVFDQRYRDRYVFAGLPPGKPLPRRWYAAGAVVRADDLAGLAAAAGIGRRRPGQDRDQVQRVRRGGQGRGVRPRRLGV